MAQFSFLDLFLSLFYAIVVLAVANYIQTKNLSKNIAYQYLTKAVFVKLLGTYFFCLVYLFFYPGQDTSNYFYSSTCVANLLEKNFSQGLQVLFGDNSWEAYTHFSNETNYPMWGIFKDSKSFSVVRFTVPFLYLGFKQFITTSIIVASVAFTGIWQLFLLLHKLYPSVTNKLQWGILYLPSTLFWSSGILKDTFTFSATCWFVVSFYHLFILKNNKLKNALFLILAVYFLVAIKPYILYSLIPGSLIWLSYNKIQAIKNKLIRVSIAPLIVLLALLGSYFVLLNMSSFFGKFSLENATQQAQIIQQDLIRDAYGENKFDIGYFDGTPTSMLSKAHLAINAALFRPYIFEARNPFMFIAAIENSVLLIFVIFLIFKKGFIAIYNQLKQDAFLLFALIFVLMLAFIVGLTTANFGALIRYKIPLMPFFTTLIIVLVYKQETLPSAFSK